MKICFISKYPPIEGGLSSKVYWLAKALGKRGHEVHIVTNAQEVEDKYRETLDINDPNYSPKNVYIHSTDPSPTIEANPSHIPFSKMYCEKLASLAIKVIEEHNIEVIDSWYLIPYCVSGFIAKSFTNVPQIIRYGGSDSQRLYPSPYLNNLLDKIIKSTDTSTTTTIPMQKVTIDSQTFHPKVMPMNLSSYITNQKYIPGIPIISYIGKITHHFETRGLCDILKACSKINSDFLLLFVANGTKLDEFKILVKNANLLEKSIFLDFVPPWQIPSILQASTCILALEKISSPVLQYHTPALPAEALATGKCVLMSEALHKKEPYNKLIAGNEILMVDPNNTREIREIVEELIEKPETASTIGKEGYRIISKLNQFNEYLDKTIELYKSTLDISCLTL